MSPPLLLVVEDDDDVREALMSVLSDAGYGTTWAGDGVAAMDALHSGLKPAAILLDLMMTRMNGFEFRAEQQADPAFADIPVIVLTAARAAERAASTLRVAACLPKPAGVDDLLAVVSRVVGPVSG